MATGRIGVTPTLGTRWSKAPAGGTTSLSGLDDNSVSLVYSVGYEQVYRNGVLLSRTNDYTATTGNSITLIDATIAGDIIEVFAQELVPLTDAISKGQFTAKGALLSATAASTPGVLTVGSNDQVLTADSSTSTGLKWATPSSGGMTSLASGSIAAAATGIDITSISSDYVNLILFMRNYSPSTTCELRLRLNNNSSGDYSEIFIAPSGAHTQQQGSTYFYLGDIQQAGQTGFSAVIELPDYKNTTGYKQIVTQMSAADNNLYLMQGFTRATAAINRITVLVSTGTFDSGTYELFGVK